MSNPVVRFTSKVVPMPAANIDTDQIIPAKYVSVRRPDEFAFALFRNLREEQPDHVLNRPEMQGREIIVGGPNFGCGSSREAAVWALVHGGFRAVIAPSFGDIFYGNALKNALLPIRVTDEIHEALSSALADEPELDVVVDLPAGEISTIDGAISAPIEIDPFYRRLLLDGIDELDYLLGVTGDAEDFEHHGDVHPSTRRRLTGTTQ